MDYSRLNPQMNPQMNPPKYIIRVENAWRVKIEQGDHCATTKQFNFDKYRGIKRALAKAVIWRDIVLCDWGMFESLNYKKGPDLCSTKTHACIGVYISNTIYRGKLFYNWTSRGQPKRHYSINKYGNLKAFQAACAYRYSCFGTIIVLNKKLTPCKPGVPYIMNTKIII